MQSFRNLWNETFESEVCKEQLLQKAKIVHSRTDFWRFQTSAQKDYKCSPYLVHFLFPFSKKCDAKTLMLYSTQHLCALDTGDYEDYGCRWWWSYHHKWVESAEGGPVWDGMMGKWGWRDGQLVVRLLDFCPQKMLSMEEMKHEKLTEMNSTKTLQKTWSFDPTTEKPIKQKIPDHEMAGEPLISVVSVAGKPHTFRWAFWGEESRALRGEIWNEGTKHGFHFFWYVWPRLFFSKRFSKFR